VFSCLVASVCASYCTGGPSSDAQPNLFPITAPEIVLNRSVPNGKLFYAQHTAGNVSLPVVHLYGSPHQMGFAHGSLLKGQAIAMWDAFWAYLVKDAGSESDLKAMLAQLESTSAPFVPEFITQELHGLADATQYDFRKLLWLHLFPESAGGHCSMFGAWGNMTRDSMGGKLLQMRALDYITDDFLSANHALIVYHPATGHAFVNIGWVGQIATVTAVSAAKLALSQIGVSKPDDSFGPQRNGQGTPFIFLLRDLMQHQGTLAGAEAFIANASRTLDLILGVGDGKLPVVPATAAPTAPAPFTGVQYAADSARFYADWNLLPVNASWHRPVTHAVYHGMDWDCPAWTGLLGDKLRQFSGRLTPAITVREITPLVQTGSLHVAIYELEDEVLYLSTSLPSTAEGPRKAFERAPVHALRHGGPAGHHLLNRRPWPGGGASSLLGVGRSGSAFFSVQKRREAGKRWEALGARCAFSILPHFHRYDDMRYDIVV
jgi:hypothetical protein